jgi:hypothetical protein
LDEYSNNKESNKPAVVSNKLHVINKILNSKEKAENLKRTQIEKNIATS